MRGYWNPHRNIAKSKTFGTPEHQHVVRWWKRSEIRKWAGNKTHVVFIVDISDNWGVYPAAHRILHSGRYTTWEANGQTIYCRPWCWLMVKPVANPEASRYEPRYGALHFLPDQFHDSNQYIIRIPRSVRDFKVSMRNSLNIWASESNRVSGSRTLKWSTDISPAPDGHNRDLPRFPEIPLARGWTHQETSKAVSSSQLHGQADRDAQSCFIHDGQKGAVEDHESNSEAPKVRRRRRRSRKSRLVREGAEMWQDNEVRVQPSGSGVQPFGNFPVQPWAYYPPAFMIAMPVTVVPFAPIMAGSSGLTVTNVAGNVTNVQMYDNNSTNVRVNKGTVDPFFNGPLLKCSLY